MYDRVLVAYDGSAQAEAAFTHGLEIAIRLGASLHVLSVAQLPEPATRVELDAILESATEHFEAAFGTLRERAASRGVEIRTEIAIGHPADKIISVAEREKADLIVVGHRGLSTIQRWMLGSVSGRVLGYAHCPVLVVR
jgi:nucleotide-binding universal stress UspA family protein